MSEQSSNEITADDSNKDSSSSSTDQFETSPSTEGKIEKIKIILDNPQNTYCSGQTIRGTISLNCAQRTQIRGIYFRVTGYGKCNWIDLLRRDSIPENKNVKPDIKYWGNEEYIDATVYVIGSKNGRPFHLLKGTTTYNFTYSLESKLPSSFSGDCGKIKYKMEFVVDKPWKLFDDKQTVVLNVIQTVDLNKIENIMTKFEKQVTKTIGIIGSGPLSLYISIPKRGYVFGDSIPIEAIVANHSKVRVEKLKFGLYRIVEYHSMAPSKAVKKVTERLVKKEVDCGDKNDKQAEQKFEQTIDVPVTTPTQDSNTSKLVHINFELKVEIKLPKMSVHKNLILTAPIAIGNVPYFTNETESAVLRSNLPQQMPMPHDVNCSRASVFSNWSLDIYPQINGDRSSIQTLTHYSPTAPVAMNPSAMIATPMTSNTPYPLLPNVSMSPISPVSPANMYAGHLPFERPMSLNSPSAPPLDFDASNTPLRPQSLFINRPPSYDEVFGFPGHFNQMNISNAPSLLNTSCKSDKS